MRAAAASSGAAPRWIIRSSPMRSDCRQHLFRWVLLDAPLPTMVRMAPFDEPPEVPLGDVLSDVPLFREIQRVLLSGTGPVNWELARQVGIAVASWGVEDPRPTEQDRAGLADTVRVAELAVADFTGLPSLPDVATVEAFRRTDWVEANARGLRDLIEPVATRLSRAMADQPGTPPAPL